MPDRSSRRWLPLPSGALIPLMRCDDPVWLSAIRAEAKTWLDRFPQIGEWLYTTIAETERHAYLHRALSGMSTPSTGGFLRHLKVAQHATALYLITSSFEVALCHRDPAMEGGPGELRLQYELFEKGMISMPPWIARLREIEASGTPIDIIVLPPSPQMSNQMRLQLATPALVRKRTLEELGEVPL